MNEKLLFKIVPWKQNVGEIVKSHIRNKKTFQWVLVVLDLHNEVRAFLRHPSFMDGGSYGPSGLDPRGSRFSTPMPMWLRRSWQTRLCSFGFRFGLYENIVFEENLSN